MKIDTKEDFEIAFNHESWSVRLAAVRSKHFEAKHMEIALNDKYFSVRLEAVKSKHFNSFCYIRCLDDHYKEAKYYED